MTASGMPIGLPPVSQLVVQDLTRAAIFLVVTLNPGMTSRAAVRSFCGDLPGLLRSVGFRDIEGNLSCVMGIGSDAWDRLFGQPRPAELHPFREIKAGPRHAVAEPVEGGADELREQRLLGPEHPEHVGLRDARLARDRLDRCTVQSLIGELGGGDAQYLGSPFRSAHPPGHDRQATSRGK